MIINTNNTRQAANVQFSYNFATDKKLFVCYKHSVEYAEGVKVMYIGSCGIDQLTFTYDCRRNDLWRKHVLTAGNVIVQVSEVFETPVEASNEARRLIKELQPFCNIHGRNNRVKPTVVCVEDGLEFDTASDAAKYYGIHVSTMSNHLNRREGYDTIHNRTFKRN